MSRLQSSKIRAVLVALAVAATLPFLAAPSVGAPVVINEVYGGGGNSGAPFNRDFIELVNKTTAAVDLSTWSVQYASAGRHQLEHQDQPDRVDPGRRPDSSSAERAAPTGAPITADIDGAINLSGTAGKVALVNNQTALPGSHVHRACSDLPQVVDFVGYGTANDWRRRGRRTPAPTNTTSVSRNSTSTNTANNAADFTAGTPTPGARHRRRRPAPRSPKTIAEVQGTGAASPLVGENVITKGVVTAAYPTGGFHGFYLQTQGTGGPSRAPAAPRTASSSSRPSRHALDADASSATTSRSPARSASSAASPRSTAAAADIVDAGDALSPVRPLTGPWPTTDAGRESLEGMLLPPDGRLHRHQHLRAPTSSARSAWPSGTTPLLQHTEVARPGSPEAAAVVADNAERAVTLDDGASTNFLASFSARRAPRPTLPGQRRPDPAVRLQHQAGAGRCGRHLHAPVVVDYRFNLWRFQPTAQVVGPDNATSPATFENTRTAAPDTATSTGGTPTSGSRRSTCSTTSPTSVTRTRPAARRSTTATATATRSTAGCDQRGAWDAARTSRASRSKIVKAINALDADVVGLMEIENSAGSVTARQPDEAPQRDLGQGAATPTPAPARWAFVPSSTELPPPTAGRDHQRDHLQARRGQAGRRVARARHPERRRPGLRQRPRADRPGLQGQTGGGEQFLFVVNHFKSKGSAGPFPGDEDTGDGQGASQRVPRAAGEALRDWVPTVLDRTTKAVVHGRRLQLLHQGGPAGGALRRRATPTWAARSSPTSTRTRSAGCPARWTTSW